MIVFPNAKINLGLHVINKREDGFHNLETSFLSVNRCDMLEMMEQKSWVNGEPLCQLTTFGLAVDGEPANNLIVKAYHLLSQKHQLPPIEVCLYKNIPMGAGLGGGSSDAAFMLKLLNEQFKLGESTSNLKSMAAQLGSDCAFFIDNQTAFVYGKGHELEPISIELSGMQLVLLCPPLHSSTSLAYQMVKPRGLTTPEKSLRKLLQWPVDQWKNNIENDFESSVFAKFPELAQIKENLYHQGATYASMSGSGSAMFGLFKQQNIPEFEYQVLSQKL